MLKQILLVGAGGAAGSILRFLPSVWIVRTEPWPFPVATFIVNIIGCFCIGIFANLIPSENLRFLLITGFCGGFTTFSTFASENMILINNNQTGMAVIYIIASVLVGLGAVWLGMFITK